MNMAKAAAWALALLTVLLSSPGAAATPQRPNIVLIVADDLGYGDLGAYGAKRIRTPNIDALAKRGATLTQFYASANLCTPSRAGLLTGRYPVRTGLAKGVIFADDTNGLPLSERTIASLLKPHGYATGFVGKWHLGHVAPFWPPTRHGFDSFFGLPYSHDMKPLSLQTADGRGVVFTEDSPDLGQLTQRFTGGAVGFIEQHRRQPFFLVVAHTAPHVPLLPHASFHGRSKASAYGDVVEELDDGIGRVVAALRRLGMERNTLVVVTSDNGPWFEGSAGTLRDRKGATGDGGYRVPLIASLPGRIPAGVTRDAISMNIDLLPTILGYAGVPVPGDRMIDGRDLRRVLASGGPSPHDALFLFDHDRIAAIRTQRWKMTERVYYQQGVLQPKNHSSTLLFDMLDDAGETYSQADRQPAVVKALAERLARARTELEPAAETGATSSGSL